MEVIVDVLKTLLSAEFPKLCFLGGFVLLFLAVCKRISLGPLQLPPLDWFGRILASVIGLALISVTVVSWYIGTTIGLVGSPKQSAITSQNSLRFIERAFAQSSEKIQTINIEQRHVKKIKINNEYLYIYVGDIGLTSSNNVLIFISKQYYDNEFNEKSKIEYDDIIKKLKNEDIVLSAKIKEGNEISFDYQRKKFKLKVLKVIWNLIGSDFMDIQIIEL